MRRSLNLGVAVAALSVAAPTAALPPGFKARADALLTAAYPSTGPGASVAISERGRIVYQGQRGLADIAARRPITAATVFRIGSITKQFASAVVLQLAAEGRLKLDDPIATYLPTYPNGAAITVRQLLNHSSGIQSYTGILGWMVEANTNRPYTTAQLIAVFKDAPAPTPPGTTWNYNNSGYVLVGALIEAVTKRPWTDEVRRRIAAPLGLASLRDGIDESSITAMARGYTGGPNGATQLANRIHMSVPGAAGALIATATDITRWGDALHHGKVVPAPWYAQMIAPTKFPDGTTVPYGFGIGTGTVHGAATIGHNGGIFGFASASIYLPRADVFVTVLTNSDARSALGETVLRRLAAMTIGQPYPTFARQPLNPAAVAPFLGAYKLKGKDRYLAIDDGKLLYVRPESATSALVPVGGNRFAFGLDTLSWVELTRDAAGRPAIAVFADGENDDGLLPHLGDTPASAKPLTVPGATLARYVGSYTASIGKVVIAPGTDGRLTVQLAGQQPLALVPTSPTDFTVERVAAKLRFVVEGGRIVRLEIAQGGGVLPATRD